MRHSGGAGSHTANDCRSDGTCTVHPCTRFVGTTPLASDRFRGGEAMSRAHAHASNEASTHTCAGGRPASGRYGFRWVCTCATRAAVAARAHRARAASPQWRNRTASSLGEAQSRRPAGGRQEGAQALPHGRAGSQGVRRNSHLAASEGWNGLAEAGAS
eukprot:7153232-Prymnesium_polylepis.1